MIEGKTELRTIQGLTEKSIKIEFIDLIHNLASSLRFAFPQQQNPNEIINHLVIYW